MNVTIFARRVVFAWVGIIAWTGASAARIEYTADHRGLTIQGAVNAVSYQRQDLSSPNGSYQNPDFLASLNDSVQVGGSVASSSASLTSIAEMPVGDHGSIFALGSAMAQLTLANGVQSASASGSSVFDMTFAADTKIRMFVSGNYQTTGGANTTVRLFKGPTTLGPLVFEVASSSQPIGAYTFNPVLDPGIYRLRVQLLASVDASAPPNNQTANFVLNNIFSSAADFDQNRFVDCNDINALVAVIAAGTHNVYFDLNGDGLVNLADRDEWLAIAGAIHNTSGNPYLLGDANLDGVVDGQDFVIWNANKFTSNPAWCAGDFNADGSIDGADFIMWNARKFTSSDVNLAPEPGAYALCALVYLLGLRLSTDRRSPY